MGIQVGSAFKGIGVIIHCQDHVSIEGERAGQVVAKLILAVLKQCSWRIGEVKVIVVDHEHRRIVVAVEDGPAALHLNGTLKAGLRVGFVDRDLHGAGDPLF